MFIEYLQLANSTQALDCLTDNSVDIFFEAAGLFVNVSTNTTRSMIAKLGSRYRNGDACPRRALPLTNPFSLSINTHQ